MPCLGLRVSFGCKDELFDLEEFFQPRLLAFVRKVSACGTQQQHIWNVCFLGRLDQFVRDVEFVFIGRGNDTYRVRFRLLKRFHHIFHPSWLVRNDGRAELSERLAVGVTRLQGETDDGANLRGKVLVGEQELGNSEASVAINGGDTNITRHSDGSNEDL